MCLSQALGDPTMPGLLCPTLRLNKAQLSCGSSSSAMTFRVNTSQLHLKAEDLVPTLVIRGAQELLDCPLRVCAVSPGWVMWYCCTSSTPRAHSNPSPPLSWCFQMLLIRLQKIFVQFFWMFSWKIWSDLFHPASFYIWEKIFIYRVLDIYSQINL